MFNILVTSSSRKVSLVGLFKKALKDLSLEGKVYAADASPLSASLYKAKNFVISPKTEEENYLTWLSNFCLEKGIKLIIPTRDEELVFFAGIKESFYDKGIHINISSEETIAICNDKQKFYEYCKREDIPMPGLFDSIEAVRYPCFVKGRYGKGSRLAFRISDKTQLQFFLSMVKEYVIQEYVDWPEYSVDYFADFNGRPVSVVPRERITKWSGESFIGKTFNDRFLIDKVVDFCVRLGLIGHNTVQLFYNRDSKEIKFIEVNPRFGGGASLGIAAGANTPLFLIKAVLNQPIRHNIYDFEDNMYMLRYTEDVFIKEKELRK